MKQYLIGGPHDGKVVYTTRPEQPALNLALYSATGEFVSLERYELRPFTRLDRRYWAGTVDEG